MVRTSKKSSSALVELSEVSEIALYSMKRADRCLTDDDLNKIKEMGMTLCSPAVIAGALGLCEADFYSDENKERFSVCYGKARAEAIAKIQGKQIEIGVGAGNVPMLIHLGKAYCGQTETINIHQTVVDVTEMSLDELAQRLNQG